MTIYRVQVFEQAPGQRPWTNVYHVQATTIEFADDAANVICNRTQDLLSNVCKIVKRIVSDPLTHTFITTAMDLAGADAGAGDLLPFFNTARVLINVAGHGRNDMKYLRGLLGESNTAGQQLSSGTISGIETVFNAMIDDLSASATPLVDNAGNLWGAVSVQADIQDRQRHRRRKKKV